MNREFLKGLGLEDDAIDKIMAEHGKTVNKTKDDLTSVTTERDELTTQLEERDTQLEALKGKAEGNEDLTAEIERLKAENANTATEYQGKLADQQKEFAIESALREAKARDPKLAKSALDLEIIHIKEGKVSGLEEQLTALKESHDYLFDSGEGEEGDDPTKLKFSTGKHSKNTKLSPEDFSKMSYKERLELRKSDPEKYSEMVGK